jgi:hypothetical protein
MSIARRVSDEKIGVAWLVIIFKEKNVQYQQ